MINQIIVLLTTFKLFFIPLYHSTDFEVHRNWLAITHNLTIDQWYYESTSEWTLDYPPFFAWLEYGLSHIAKLFDPEIGKYLWAAFWFSVLLNLKHIFLYIAPVYVVYLLRAYCFTVTSTDGVHTAWYSFSSRNLLKLAFIVITVFTISFGPFIQHIPQILSRLFPFKRGLCHAYWAPNFWALYNFGDKVLQYVLPIFGISVSSSEASMTGGLVQEYDHVILSRLFPFKRGLCHAYWAPNFWALYNFGDKVLQYVLPIFGISVSSSEASMTGGLVQEYDHVVLPSITPTVTFILTLLSMVPALIKLWNLCADKKYRAMSFIRCITVCATCSFMFGWHVHEKAILMILIPISFLAVLGDVDGRLFLFLSTVGNYSLFPLLYPKSLIGIKLFLLLTHCAIAFGNLPALYVVPKVKGTKRIRKLRLPMLSRIECLYIYNLIGLWVYENAIHFILGLDKRLPFLPLMFTSVYCALGVLYFWIRYYYYFLTFNLSMVPIQSVESTPQHNKKIK
ncbi:putative dolichyl pyrophosphate Glc1Man9GlcNAc2 alpha-1,3-glucosyltransferase [Papilio machaon]|uniref:Alpha-1,3-glucosyltransferase n=1 Tax=Papilio machaon TaxID=76193 RepID=A0A194RGH3_PAPMA|nr:putative dolichyl pyrophosphate Glc1Man9GlcNAc2 alpha-1,3-glucosyltransferase [Papilio machaon]